MSCDDNITDTHIVYSIIGIFIDFPFLVNFALSPIVPFILVE